MNILCVLGRHQYGDPARGEGIEYGSFIPALRRLGHDVGHFDSLDLARRADLSKLNSDLLCEVDRDKPDVLLVVHHEHEIWTETLDILRCRRGPALICWTTDDSWKYREFSRFVGRHYHAMTTTYPDCVEKYHRDGIRSVLLTQWAANSEWLQSPKPASECRFPVSFVGQAYGDRAKMIDKIRKTGVDVACFGQGWPSGPIAAGDIPGIMRDSVISLSFSGIPRWRRGGPQVKARTFEVPGAGGFLLTEYAPGLERAFVVGEEIAAFQGAEEACEKIRFYLGDPKKRDEIARSGHNRTRREHTWEVRMKEVVDFAVSARDRSRARARQPGLSPRALHAAQRPPAAAKSVGTALAAVCSVVFGKKRGPKAARRIVHEVSWRLQRERAYSSRGWTGQLFPNV